MFEGVALKSLLLAGLALTACAEASMVDGINAAVNDNHPYKHYAKHDYRELQDGEPGNCAAIAYTKQQALKRAGISSTLITCRLLSGEGHAFLLTNEGALDNRFNSVIPLKEVGCAW